MKANEDNCHFLSILDLRTRLLLPASILENLGSQKLLAVTIDRKSNFKGH